jgi:hypothetical protein
MPFRHHKSVAVLCIAIAVFAVVVPAVALGMPQELLTPVWMYEPPAATVSIADDLVAGHEQTGALLDPCISRGPPRSHTA